MQADQDYWADAARHHAEGQAMLANMRGQLFQTVVVGIPQAVASVQQQRAQLETLRIAAEQETALRRAAEAAQKMRPANGAVTVTSRPPAPTPPPGASSSRTAAIPPASGSITSTRPAAPTTPKVCTTPGGSREWNTVTLTPLADARAEYEKEAAWARGKGNSIGPMQCGKTATVFGVASAICRATITWPEKSSPCGTQVSPQ